MLFIIPAILDGSPPLLVAVVGTAAIMFAALCLTHGVTVHTSVPITTALAVLVADRGPRSTSSNEVAVRARLR
jgi:uncharacterized membrane protein